MAKQYGIMVMTNYETSWYATNHHINNLLQDGTLGNIRRLNIYDGHEGPKEINCSERFLEWLTDPVLNGGGAVIDFGCYGANLATWYLKGEIKLQPYDLASLENNMMVVRILNAAIESARTGEVVKF